MACLSESPLSAVFTGYTLLEREEANESGQFQGRPGAIFSYFLLPVLMNFPSAFHLLLGCLISLPCPYHVFRSLPPKMEGFDPEDTATQHMPTLVGITFPQEGN